MQGIIFNLVEDAVVAEHGDDVWDSILDKAGLDGVYTALGTYPDAELTELVDAGSVVLDAPPEELTRGLGRSALLALAQRYPYLFEGFTTTRAFLLTLDDVVHAEVRRLHADARPPDFWFDELPDGDLRVHYRSERRLCALAEGMVSGAASYFAETAQLTQSQCMLAGAEHCVIDARFRTA